MHKSCTLFTLILILSSCSTLWCMDNNSTTQKFKTHYFGRPGILEFWSSDLSREEIKQQFENDAKNLALSINKKFPKKSYKTIPKEFIEHVKVCDATIDFVFEKNPHPSTIEAMVMWTCRNWGKRAQGTPDKVIIKAAHNQQAQTRWTTGLTYMVENAEYRKLRSWSISEGVPIVALTLKKHHNDPAIQQLEPELLKRLAAFEKDYLENYDPTKSYTRNQDPSNIADMIIYTCLNWNKLIEERKIIKPDTDADAINRWTTGITYLIDHTGQYKYKTEDLAIVASTLKANLEDPVIKQLDPTLLKRLATFESTAQQKAPQQLAATIHNNIKIGAVTQQDQKAVPVQQRKSYAQALKYRPAQAFNQPLDCTPGQLVFEDPVAKQRKREYKQKKKQWYN